MSAKPTPSSKTVDSVRQPPTRWTSILTSIGPGLIVAGSIVGSGELIATTKTGAEAGMKLLWLIVLGCIVKVFVQIEFGRYAIISGKTTLAALDEVPGPRIRGRGNWLVWYWMLMWLASISQLGGIVGAVGQSLSLSIPITQAGVELGEAQDRQIAEQVRARGFDFGRDGSPAVPSSQSPREGASELPEGAEVLSSGDFQATLFDDVALWAIVVSVLTAIILYRGKYGLIQSLSTVLVTSFTLLTLANFFLLQSQPDFAVTWQRFTSGFTFGWQFSEGGSSTTAVRTALATFGIIGVGAAELIVYPYWCLEKGYAKYVGRRPDRDSPEMTQWLDRAKGWLKVMRVDAWGAMVVYTFATMAFYLLGASILHPLGLNPADNQLVRTLAVMYEPVFGPWAASIFLFGAFAVLYSTFFVANASHARTFADAIAVMGFIQRDPETIARWVQRLSAAFPILCVLIYLAFPRPAALVLFSGVAQGVMLPMLGVAALYFRYRKTLVELMPGRIWDGMLLLSVVAMTVTGVWTVVKEVTRFLAG